ncbi:MAG: class I SAM-dependent methyltransferase [Ignavibacterium sp.]|nr:class I SAM-dependent methyltransferase [Ignavibacterium sp.]
MALTLRQKISSIGYFLTHPKALRMIFSMKEFGYLCDEGWFKSLDCGEPVDKNGEPIPWFTYPAIDFLKERLNKNMTVFEYGSGSSTLFFAKRVKEIISVETDKEWYEKIKLKMPANVKIILYEKDKSDINYSKVIDSLNKKYDIILIDAIERNEVLMNAANYLNEGGVIILDNSDRIEYKNSINELIDFHFYKIDFWGIQAAYLNKTCTTIIYKTTNCLGI